MDKHGHVFVSVMSWYVMRGMSVMSWYDELDATMDVLHGNNIKVMHGCI